MDSPAASMDSDESTSPSSSSDSFDSMLEEWDREDAMISQMMTIAHNNTRLLMMSDDEWSDEEEEEVEGKEKDKEKERDQEEEEEGEPSVNPNTVVRDVSAMAAPAVNSLNGYDHHVLGMAAPSPATNSSNGGVRDASAMAAPAINSLNAYDRHVLGMANPAPATNSSNVGVRDDVSAMAAPAVSSVNGYHWHVFGMAAPAMNSLNGCDRHVFGTAAPAPAPATNPSNGSVRDVSAMAMAAPAVNSLHVCNHHHVLGMADPAPATSSSNGGVRDDAPAMADPATHAQEWRTTRATHPSVDREPVKETEAEAEEMTEAVAVEEDDEEDEVKEDSLEGMASLAFLPSGSMSGHFLHPPSSTCLGLFGTEIACEHECSHGEDYRLLKLTIIDFCTKKETTVAVERKGQDAARLSTACDLHGWDKEIVLEVSKGHRAGVKPLAVNFECETLKADREAEHHIKRFLPSLVGRDAVVNIGRMTIKGLKLAIKDKPREDKVVQQIKGVESMHNEESVDQELDAGGLGMEFITSSEPKQQDVPTIPIHTSIIPQEQRLSCQPVSDLDDDF